MESGSKSMTEFADLNLFIYIVFRDAKLLELRDSIESAVDKRSL